MQLDYVPSTDAYTLHVPRKDPMIEVYMKEHGLDFSTPASTADVACLFTKDPYAASAYVDYALPRAKQQLGDLLPAIEASWAQDSSHKVIVGPGQDNCGQTPYPFQKAGVAYGVDKDYALIGDSPGLGKTEQSIWIANERRCKRILVVCPASVRIQWAERIRFCSNMEGKYLVYPILKSSDGVHPRAEWTVISYDLLRSRPVIAALREQRFDLVILDEAHYLKTADAQRTKAVFGADGLAGETGSVLALTGTPLPNRPRECYTLARALCWSSIDFMSEKQFRERYNPLALIEITDPFTGKKRRATREEAGRGPELQARLRANFMVRRLKRDVLDQLPEISYEIIHTDKDDGIRRALEAEKLLDIDPENLKGASATELGHVSTVRKMMGIAKVPHIIAYINTLIDGGEEKLVVFGWHIEVLNQLEQALQRHGLVRVDGSTSPRMKALNVRKFIDDERCKIFLGNLQSIGVGTDGLQKVCNRGIFAECSWTPSDNEQGVGRLERIGQKWGILIDFIVAPGSFDERVLGTAIRKLKGIHSALDERI